MSGGQETNSQDDLLAALRSSATLSGLPEPTFFSKFTARQRREITYRLRASAPGLDIEVKVRGSGAMTAVVRMPCVMMEEGTVCQLGEAHSVAWAQSGEEAVLMSPLGHRHLESYPQAVDILDGFFGAMRLRCTAVGAGGFRQWKSTMQLLTTRIARERGCPVEVVAIPPMPSEKGNDAGTRHRATQIETNDISDAETPVAITGYDADFTAIEEAFAPEAVSLMMLPPGFIVRRTSRQIFQAG